MLSFGEALLDKALFLNANLTLNAKSPLNAKSSLNVNLTLNAKSPLNNNLTQFDPQILISDVYDGKIKY